MFHSSVPFAFLDYFRVPCAVVPDDAAGLPPGIGVLRPDQPGPGSGALYWCRADARRSFGRTRTGLYRLDGFQIAGHLVRGTTATRLAELPGTGRWREVAPVRDLQEHQVAAVWADEHGSVFLPFDPGEVMTSLWSERYTSMGSRRIVHALRKMLVTCYYAARPLLPRKLQLMMRRGYAAAQLLPDFPGWPEEHCLHDMYAWLFDLLAGIAGEPVPYLSPWPRGKEAAFVLTHDVETAAGRDAIEALRAPERALGLRSSWNFVPERYDVPELLLKRLQAEGCEIGVHGLRHDGQDLASARKLARRLPAMRAYASKWDAVGFRSPATQRSWKLMPTMGFDYDSSYIDTAPLEPQPGGSCTYLPFFNEQLVELPMTLPMDHTLFEILGHTDGRMWRDKTAALRRRGGMVLVLVHPDYTAARGLLDAWRELLVQLADDPAVWHALPREVSAWWRRRAASSLQRTDGWWSVTGPAADEAEIRFAGRSRPAYLPAEPTDMPPERSVMTEPDLASSMTPEQATADGRHAETRNDVHVRQQQIG
jgi:peptidoglycan/xylan/chitin deacetylase (PgdA/CDA1 family)